MAGPVAAVFLPKQDQETSVSSSIVTPNGWRDLLRVLQRFDILDVATNLVLVGRQVVRERGPHPLAVARDHGVEQRQVAVIPTEALLGRDGRRIEDQVGIAFRRSPEGFENSLVPLGGCWRDQCRVKVVMGTPRALRIEPAAGFEQLGEARDVRSSVWSGTASAASCGSIRSRRE